DIRVNVRNTLSHNQPALIKTTFYDGAGAGVGSVSSEMNAASGAVTGIEQKFALNNPHRWSLEDPYLYKAVTEVYAGGKAVDSYTTFIGVRSFDFDAG